MSTLLEPYFPPPAYNATPGSSPCEKHPGWHAIRVRSRAEKVVASILDEKGYDCYLPLYRKRNRWSDRNKELELPVFPGYVFCRAELAGKPHIVLTPNVIGFLTFGSGPALVSNQEIEALKRVARSDANVEPWPFVREGQRVRICQGSLAGLEGIVVRTKSDWRLVLSVDALCRSVAVEIYRESAIPIDSNHN